MSKPDEPTPSEKQALQSALAELSPSPYLEDAVVDIAREDPWGESRLVSRSPTWVAAAAVIAIAAFFVTAAWLIAPRNAEVVVTLPHGDSLDVSASVYTPPTRAQIARARDRAPLPAWGEHPRGRNLWNSIGSTANDGETVGYSGPAPGPLPFDPQLRHRYLVNSHERDPYELNRYQYVSAPEAGVLLAGQGLLEAIGDVTVAGAGTQMRVFANGREWRPVPGTRFLEVFLRSPDANGAEARVWIAFSTAYTGSLLVEEPLARALALYQFEIPGGVELIGPRTIRGSLARARVRIPDLEVDTTLHVQVDDRRQPWNVIEAKRSPEQKASAWIRVRGAVPNDIAHADGVEMSDEGGLSVMNEANRMDMMSSGVPMLGSGTESEVGMFREGPTQICFDYDETPERPRALLFLGSIDVDPKERWTYVYDVEWVTVPVDWSPGARVIVARTWRGTTAIPSKEGVAVTRVSADGKVRFPRVVGEAGNTLKLLAEGKDGRGFHVVSLDERQANATLVVEVRPDSVTIEGTRYAVTTDEGADWEPVKAHLERAVNERAGREPDGASELELEIRAAPDASYRMVQAVLLIGAVSDLKIYKVSFGVLGSPKAALEVPLPKDKALDDDSPELPQIEVELESRNGVVRLVMHDADGERAVDVPLGGDRKSARRLLSTRIRAWARQGEAVGLVSVAPPGDDVPYAAIHFVIGIFLEAGVERVSFTLTERFQSPK